VALSVGLFGAVTVGIRRTVCLGSLCATRPGLNVATLLNELFLPGARRIVAWHSVLYWGLLGVRRDSGRLGHFAHPGGIVICVLFVEATNISIIKADIFYQAGTQFEGDARWDYAASLYEKGSSLRLPRTTMTSVFLGRAFMEWAKQQTDVKPATRCSLSRSRLWSKPSG